MVVVQGVVDHAAFPPIANKAKGAQQPKLMAHRRLAHAQDCSKIAHTELRGGEGVENAHPGWIPKGPKDLSKSTRCGLVYHRGEHQRDPLRVNGLYLTGDGIDLLKLSFHNLVPNLYKLMLT